MFSLKEILLETFRFIYQFVLLLLTQNVNSEHVQIAVEEVTVGADVDVVDIVGKCAKN
jgi:hypothetical protein